jgi:hypothetical protein
VEELELIKTSKVVDSSNNYQSEAYEVSFGNKIRAKLSFSVVTLESGDLSAMITFSTYCPRLNHSDDEVSMVKEIKIRKEKK